MEKVIRDDDYILGFAYDVAQELADGCIEKLKEDTEDPSNIRTVRDWLDVVERLLKLDNGTVVKVEWNYSLNLTVKVYEEKHN